MRSPLFFLSYAHQPGRQRKRNVRFVRFFEDLSENVAELVSRPAGSDPGYMDTMIPDGDLWPEDLLDAIGSCRVFVALLSPRYVDSDMCAKEWFAFTQRRVTARVAGAVSNPTAIIPVIWAPLSGVKIPAAIDTVQRFNPGNAPKPELAAHYEREGVVGLLQLRDEDAYQAVVWRLAQRIASIHYTHDVEPRVLKVDDLQNVFRELTV